MQAIQKISNGLTKIIKVIMIVLFIYMVVSMGAHVIARYVFSAGFVWANESARYCMIWLIVIGAVEILLNDEHIKVTIIEDALKGKSKRVLLVIQDILGIVFSAMLFYYSIPQMMLAAKSVSPNMGISMAISYGIFPVITALMIIAYIFRIILAAKGGNQAAGEPEKGGEQA